MQRPSSSSQADATLEILQRLHFDARHMMSCTKLRWAVTVRLVISNGTGHGTGRLSEDFSIETLHSWWKPAPPKVQQADNLGNMKGGGFV